MITAGLAFLVVGALVGRLVNTAPPVESCMPALKSVASSEGLQSNRRGVSTKVHAVFH